MIINESDYNPLSEIFKYSLEDGLNTTTLDVVQHELFKAGVVPEDSKEFEIVLHLLTKLQKEFYGKR